MPNQIIDAWIQHPPAAFLNDPMFGSLRRWRKDGDVYPDIPLELTVSALDAAGVDRAVLCAWHGPEGAMISNEEVSACLDRFPDRFLGLASVDIRKPMEAVRTLRSCVKQRGFSGLRLLPWLWNLPPNDRRYYPLYAECCELDVPFCLQVGHTGPMHPSEPGRPIPYLDQVALEFPELTIVGGHIGYPWTQEMIALATKYPNVYIDTSAWKPKRYPVEFVDFMRGHGCGKVLFGSNYPMLLPKQCIEQIGSLNLGPETQDAFLFENARRVFRLA